jgi:hypothetical protein
MRVYNFMRCKFITDEERLVHSSGSLINTRLMIDGSQIVDIDRIFR